MEEQRPLVVAIGETFDTFYAREFRPLVALAYVLSGNRSLAEDLAQEAMASAYRNWSKVCAMDSPTGYVRRTTANLAASAVRRRLVEPKALFRLSSQRSVLPELDEPDEQFWAAVRRLPARQAQAVALRYIYDCPVAEVAELMGVSEGAAKAHLFRGRQHLVRSLELRTHPMNDGEVAS